MYRWTITFANGRRLIFRTATEIVHPGPITDCFSAIDHQGCTYILNPSQIQDIQIEPLKEWEKSQ